MASCSALPQEDHAGPPPNGKPCVLVVDDDPVNREVFRCSLEGHCHIAEMTSGVGVADYIAEHRPDLVFLDMMMPIVDGFEVVEAIQQKHPAYLASIVLVTAAASDPRVMRLSDCGVAGVHERPYDPDEIVGLMQKYIGSGERR